MGIEDLTKEQIIKYITTTKVYYHKDKTVAEGGDPMS